MSAIESSLDHVRRRASDSAVTPKPAAPARKLVVITCMDARIDPAALLGLAPGDAHVLRNAGGVVTDDTIRSLAISQRLLGTREIMVIHHSGCGLLTFTDEEFKDAVEKDTGTRPTFAIGTFRDLDEDVRKSLDLIRTSPFVQHVDSVRGFVHELETESLREVE